MEDKNKNLEDFLRKRLSNMENEDEAWARPSQTTKQQVLEQILMPADKKQKKVLFFYVMLAAIGLLMLAYIGCLQKDIAALTALNNQHITLNTSKQQDLLPSKTEINKNSANEKKSKPFDALNGANEKREQIEKDDLIETNNSLKAIIQQQQHVITSLEKEQKQGEIKVKNSENNDHLVKRTQELLAINRVLEQQLKRLKIRNEQQKQQIKNLNEEKELLLGDLRECTTSLDKAAKSMLANKDGINEIKPIEIVDIKEEPQEQIVTPLLEDDFQLKQFHKGKKFEIGYQLGGRGIMTDVIRSVESQRSMTDVKKNKFLFAHSHGVHGSASPIRNFWIGTGFDLGFSNLYEDHNIEVAYKAGNGQVSTSGHVEDNIALSSNLGTTLIQEHIDVLFPQGISDGDLVELGFRTDLALKHYQIPLELSYRYGKKRLECIFLLGGQWNLLNYQQRIHSFYGQAKGQDLDFSKTTELKSTFSMQYWGIYIGTGLNYHISKHFNLKGLFSYEYNFIAQQSNGSNIGTQQSGGQQDIETSPVLVNLGLAFKLRLSYRF
ncbi:hypothetical protein [Aureispira anguillae]|uniref:Outer membrane protein beta-barrel domain-containing protein n=1 Tax=Aureispira anguillae TaxID=2864201 RepID=A0A915YHX6_9BACT|nr:hypothetical protein [Aureispira anguillae]BDS13291.1 hypothetical protein AsAng_0040210 [Aureispira anguillae]